MPPPDSLSTPLYGGLVDRFSGSDLQFPVGLRSKRAREAPWSLRHRSLAGQRNRGGGRGVGVLARARESGWGIALREIEGERFVVLPAGALADPPWTVGAWPGWATEAIPSTALPKCG